jgi:hypothetical protein
MGVFMAHFPVFQITPGKDGQQELGEAVSIIPPKKGSFQPESTFNEAWPQAISLGRPGGLFSNFRRWFAFLRKG